MSMIFFFADHKNMRKERDMMNSCLQRQDKSDFIDQIRGKYSVKNRASGLMFAKKYVKTILFNEKNKK